MTVAALRARMSAREWVEWQAYHIMKDQREQVEIDRAKAKRRRGG